MPSTFLEHLTATSLLLLLLLLYVQIHNLKELSSSEPKRNTVCDDREASQISCFQTSTSSNTLVVFLPPSSQLTKLLEPFYTTAARLETLKEMQMSCALCRALEAMSTQVH